MGLHYLIDGYNLLRSSYKLTRGTFDEQRERLLRLLEERRPHGSVRNELIVVFDGQPGRGWKGWRGTVRVVFSEDAEADEIIKQRVDALRNPSQAVVVTDDRAIQKWVKGAGAKVVGCRAFLPMTDAPGPERSDKLTDEEARQITDDLARRWDLK